MEPNSNEDRINWDWLQSAPATPHPRYVATAENGPITTSFQILRNLSDLSAKIRPYFYWGNISPRKTLQQCVLVKSSDGTGLGNRWKILLGAIIALGTSAKKKGKCGNFSPPHHTLLLPLVWEPHVCDFFLHFRTFETFLVFTKMLLSGWYYG